MNKVNKTFFYKVVIVEMSQNFSERQNCSDLRNLNFKQKCFINKIHSKTWDNKILGVWGQGDSSMYKVLAI